MVDWQTPDGGGPWEPGVYYFPRLRGAVWLQKACKGLFRRIVADYQVSSGSLMSRKRPLGRPRLPVVRKRLRATLRQARERRRAGADPADGNLPSLLDFTFQHGPFPRGGEVQREDWTRRRAHVWRACNGRLPCAARHFDRLTCRGAWLLSSAKWYRRFDGDALQEALDLLDADEIALAEFEKREGAAGRDIVAGWRAELQQHRQAAFWMHEGGFPSDRFNDIVACLK